jgi:hypothetical protein
MTEFTLNGRAWRMARKLDALTQLAIAIKLMPLIPSLRPVMAAAGEARKRIEAAELAIAEGREPESQPDESELSDDMLVHLGVALNTLGDDGRNYVIGACLGVVLMEVPGGGFLPAWHVGNQSPDPSIDMVTMLRLVYAVVMDNISNFSTALASK